MKNFRCIYVIEAITDNGELIMRRYSRNKRTAEKIARQCKKATSEIRKLQKREHYWINLDWVEG